MTATKQKKKAGSSPTYAGAVADRIKRDVGLDDPAAPAKPGVRAATKVHRHNSVSDRHPAAPKIASRLPTIPGLMGGNARLERIKALGRLPTSASNSDALWLNHPEHEDLLDAMTGLFGDFIEHGGFLWREWAALEIAACLRSVLDQGGIMHRHPDEPIESATVKPVRRIASAQANEEN